MEKTQIDNIIAKSFCQEADELELKTLENWKAASKVNQQVYQAMQKEWHHRHAPKKAIGEEELVDKLWNASKKRNEPNQHNFKVPFLKMAAAIALVVSFYFWYIQVEPKAENTTPAPQLVIKENSAGQKSKIHISDGTIIWLNAESSLSYKKPFSDTLREVKLEGEAYFEVAKDKDRPFIVNFDGSQVVVLGTSFNISSYAMDQKKVVSMAEGSVEIVNGNKRDYLEAGWIAEIDKTSNQITSFAGLVEDNISWIQDKLIFKEASYNFIFQKLERWYGVDIQIIGKPNHKLKFNGTFHSENLENILENLVLDNNMKYKIDKEKILITFK